MFEKEAEEYVIKKHNIDMSKQSVDFSLRCEFAEDFTDFQNGAEFGYNKANEWHYVKDGDLPKPNIAVLICLQFEKWISSYIAYYRPAIKKWQIYNLHEAQRQPVADDYIDSDEVIAWKEIVIPELKENE